MCNCGCEHKIMSEFGSITDFDVVYTGETITCGDDVIIEQGHTIRDSLDAIARVLCDKSDQTDLDDLQVKVSEVEDVANGADAKAQQALDEIDDIDMDVTPADVGVTLLGNRVPVSGGGNSWLTGGIYVGQPPTGGSIPIRYADGRLMVGDAVMPDDAVTKRQLDAIGVGVTTENINSNISNSERSLILKSVNCTIIAPNNLSKQNVILNSEDSTIGGTYSHLSSITGSRHANIGTGERNFIAASDVAEIGNRRIQTAVIASTESVIENWLSQSSLKWNSAIIASRLGRIQSSNSYSLVTGKGNTSCGSAQMVVGQNNIVEPSRSVDDPLKKAFIVGNGVGNDDPNLTVKSNAFYVTQGGKAWLQNDLEVDKAGGGVVLKSPNGTRFLLSVGDDGSLGTTEI